MRVVKGGAVVPTTREEAEAMRTQMWVKLMQFRNVILEEAARIAEQHGESAAALAIRERKDPSADVALVN